MNFNTAPTVSAWGFSGPDWGGYNIMKKDAQAQYQKEVDFTREMANTQWQRGVADMQAAGINPMLAVQQGPNASPTAPNKHFAPPPGTGFQATMQTAAQTALLHAQADNINAQTDEVRERTPTHRVSIDRMKQEITESIERIQDIRASVSERAASAWRQYQQADTLAAEIPKLKADTRRLLAQAKYYASATDLTTAQENQLQQYIKANLPEIERLHQDLQYYLAKIATPGKELDADARQSFIGILGNYLKALLPLGGIVGAVPVGKSKTIIHNPPPITIKQGGGFGR